MRKLPEVAYSQNSKCNQCKNKSEGIQYQAVDQKGRGPIPKIRVR
jgi:hypothetical protein